MALKDQAIDPSSFTLLRLASAILVLAILLTVHNSVRSAPKATATEASASKGSWLAALMLFTYASCFSYAYVSLDTATGALILFGTVQISMIVASVFEGHKLLAIECAGIALACSGLIYLLLPDLESPSLLGFILMTLAGIAWAIYTLLGRQAPQPLSATAYNFIRCSPFAAALLLAVVLMQVHLEVTPSGLLLALLSGGIASALGYTLWYSALGKLTALMAAVLQLSVPVIAAVGGIVFVAEAISIRLLIAAALIMAGIIVLIIGSQRREGT